MKKVLFATTALVLSAGVAAADIALSGDARMGFTYDGTDTTQTQRARVAFTLSGEADNGLSFGAFFRAQDTGTNTAATVFISGAFGTLTFGNNDNALVSTTHNVPHLGVLEADSGSRRTALGVGSDILYQYSVGDISFAASGNVNADENDYVVAAKFNLGPASVGVAYEKDDGTATHTLLTASGAVAGVNLVGYYGIYDPEGAGENDTQTGLSAAYTMDGITLVLRTKNDFAGENHLGLGVNYALGGGATLGAGINRVGDADATASAGVSFSF
jgi:outer membrane protein OmpU